MVSRLYVLLATKQINCQAFSPITGNSVFVISMLSTIHRTTTHVTLPAPGLVQPSGAQAKVTLRLLLANSGERPSCGGMDLAIGCSMSMPTSIWFTMTWIVAISDRCVIGFDPGGKPDYLLLSSICILD